MATSWRDHEYTELFAQRSKQAEHTTEGRTGSSLSSAEQATQRSKLLSARRSTARGLFTTGTFTKLTGSLATLRCRLPPRYHGAMSLNPYPPHPAPRASRSQAPLLPPLLFSSHRKRSSRSWELARLPFWRYSPAVHRRGVSSTAIPHDCGSQDLLCLMPV